MKESKILEGNKLIAKFMRYPKINADIELWQIGKFATPVNKLEFHSSWDWLMPVVEKIRANEYCEDFNINIFGDCIIQGLKGLNIHVYCDSISNCTITATWEAVIEFIKWYNQNK